MIYTTEIIKITQQKGPKKLVHIIHYKHCVALHIYTQMLVCNLTHIRTSISSPTEINHHGGQPEKVWLWRDVLFF